MKWRVWFRLKPTREFTQVTHLFDTKVAAQRYADAIETTCPAGLGFTPEVEVEEAECNYHTGVELDENFKCEECEIARNKDSDWARSDMAYQDWKDREAS